MKAKLLALNLSENVVDEILSVFEIHEQTVKRHSKPKGKEAFHDNVKEIGKLSRALHKKLSHLSLAERQLLDYGCNPKIFGLTGGLSLLSLSCQKVGKMNFRFSRKDPFLLDLAISLWMLLEANGVKVTRYKNSILCQTMKILLPKSQERRKYKKAESDAPERKNDWAFHLLREASKNIPKS